MAKSPSKQRRQNEPDPDDYRTARQAAEAFNDPRNVDKVAVTINVGSLRERQRVKMVLDEKYPEVRAVFNVVQSRTTESRHALGA